MTHLSKSDLWRYVKGDVYSLKQLIGYKTFFEDDLYRAEQALDRIERFRKYGLPGFHFMIVHAEMEVEESLGNLSIVDQMIDDNIESFYTTTGNTGDNYAYHFRD